MKKIIAAALAGVVMTIATPAVSNAKPNKPSPTAPSKNKCKIGDTVWVVSYKKSGTLQWITQDKQWYGLIMPGDVVLITTASDVIC